MPSARDVLTESHLSGLLREGDAGWRDERGVRCYGERGEYE